MHERTLQTTDGREFSFAKNVTISDSDRFICFISTVKQLAALTALCFEGTTKKVVNFLEEKSASGDLA